MSKKRPKTRAQLFNEYQSGQDFYKACRKSDKVKTLRMSGGSHFIVETVNGEKKTFVTHKEIATGLRWELINWCLKVGIALSIVFVAAYFFLT